MPSKKRKYNARFPAGRIKKIMQTDEEVGKVAQAVPIIILPPTPRTLELFVESLLRKAMQVTVARSAKTLSPSHVKQCILAESRFDFLRDLVKNIPDVSVAEEKEMISAESSPNASRFSDMSVARRATRVDSNSSSGSDVVRPPPRVPPEVDPLIPSKREAATSTVVSIPTEAAMDLSKKTEEERPRMANFYQETLIEPVPHRSVIQVNPTYATPQPSTSSYANLTPVPPVQRIGPLKPPPKLFYVEAKQTNNVAVHTPPPVTPVTPITPILNIDFSKNLTKPEIKVLDTAAINIAGGKDSGKSVPKLQRQNSKPARVEAKKEPRQTVHHDLDLMPSGNLQIDEDYDT